MDEKKFPAEQFEADRSRLRAVAYRMLGSASEAEDAVQEAWLRLSRADSAEIGNLSGWLTTVVGRICLDMLRSRRIRKEDPMPDGEPRLAVDEARLASAEDDLAMADSVGLALLVVLERLAPAERLAFVLHDLFAVPFDEIAVIVDRTPEAARQLASRARRRVQGDPETLPSDRAAKRPIVEAFLAASRQGDFSALIEVLDPDVVFRADDIAARYGNLSEARGGDAVAKFFLGRAQAARVAIVDGDFAAIIAPGGELRLVLRIAVANGRVVSIEAIADPETLAGFEVAALEG